MYIYRKSEEKLWTVGIYTPEGWITESDHATRELAASRVHWLNGGPENRYYEELTQLIRQVADMLHEIARVRHEKEMSNIVTKEDKS